MNNPNLSRIEQFRQLKSSIRQNNHILIIGIDVSKKSSVACITDTMKNTYLKKFRFSNTTDGLQSLIEKATELKNTHQKKDMLFAMEPTGNYHKPLASFLIKHNLSVVGISTVAAKSNRKSLDGRWKKNDPKDAYNITDLVSQGKMFFYREDPFCDSLKSLLKLRDRYSKRLSSIKTRLRNNHFAQYFPELDAFYHDILDPEVISILKNFPTAEDIQQVSFQDFYVKIYKKRNTNTQQQRLWDIWQAAQFSIARPKHPGIDLQIHITCDEIAQLHAHIKKLDKKVASCCHQLKNFKLLSTVPGFGNILSAIFLAHLGDINDYSNPAQLTKLVGLDLEYEDSGQHRGKASVSKKGSSFLRYSASQAAKMALHNKFLKDYFYNKLQLKGNTKEARAKLHIKFTDKLLRAIYVILKNQQPYNLITFLNSGESSLAISA